jgi:hypothetical protein
MYTDAELLAELQKPEYAGLTALEKVNALNALADVYFPILVPKATMLLILDPTMTLVDGLEDGPIKRKWKNRIENIRSLNEGVSPSDIGGMLAEGVTDGVLFQPQIDMFNTVGYRQGTLAEKLWGERTFISLNDVARLI